MHAMMMNYPLILLIILLAGSYTTIYHRSVIVEGFSPPFLHHHSTNTYNFQSMNIFAGIGGHFYTKYRNKHGKKSRCSCRRGGGKFHSSTTGVTCTRSHNNKNYNSCCSCCCCCNSCRDEDLHETNNCASKGTTILRLPIFPLRKRVKFPTESLQLTLWEERYKALSRYVLDHPSSPPLLLGDMTMMDPPPIFGALYASHKAQIVRGGNGSVGPIITPFVEPGDVGILCAVTQSQVFMRGQKVDVQRRHEEGVEKIRLCGVGIGRFRVDRVLSNGLDFLDQTAIREKRAEDDILPFILVEASLYLDDNDEDSNLLATDHDLIDGRLENLMSRVGITSPEEILAEYNQYQFVLQGDGEDQSKQRNRQQQMITFALTSQLESTAPAKEMLDMLKSRSIKERLDYLERKLPPPPPLLSKFRWFLD